MTLLTLLKTTTGGGGVAVGYRSSSTSGTADSQGTSKPIPVPAGAATGDIALLAIEMWWDSATNPTVTWPSGFTEIVNVNLDAEQGWTKLKVAWKRLTGADSGNYTPSWTGTQWNMGHCILITGGLASGDPIEATHTATTLTGTSVPTTTVSPAAAGDMLVNFCTNESSATQSTVPTGFTNVQNHIYLRTNYRISAASGSQSASGGVISAAGPQVVALIAVKPEADGGGSDHTETPADDEGLTDSTTFAVGDSVADNEPLTDTATLTQGKATAESLGLTDSASVSFVLDRAAADALGITDSSVVVRGVGVSAPDNLDLTDAVVLDRAQAASEALGLSDAAAITRVVAQAATENLGLTDATTQAIGQSQADLAGLTDSISIQASGAAALAPADTEGLTDAAALSRSQAPSDSEALTDTAVVGLGRDRTAAESLGLSDQVTLVVTRDIGDLLTLSDTTALIASFVRVLEESAGLTDTAQVTLTGPTARTTVRPNTGTTARPGSGITPRPFTGTTIRPG